MFAATEGYVREVNHAFKSSGFAALSPKWSGGRPAEYFVAMKNRILDLYDHPPADGRLICVDEFGSLNLQPRPGRGWFGAPPTTSSWSTHPPTPPG
jgi:hypothetical protein